MKTIIIVIAAFFLTTQGDFVFPEKDVQKVIKALFPSENIILERYTEGEKAIKNIYNGPAVLSCHRFNYSGNKKGIVYTGRVFTCRATGCGGITVYNEKTEGLESLDYFIVFDDSLQILEVSIYEYNAMHGQGVTAKSWLKQFRGFRPGTEIHYGKEIDGVSGATKSGKSVTMDVNMVLNALKDLN